MTTRGTAVTTQISPSLHLTRDQPLIDSWLIGTSTLPPHLCFLFFPNIFTLKQRYWAAAIIALMFLILSTRSKSLELDAIEWGSGISSSFLRVGNKLPEGCHPDINRWLLLSEFMVMRALEQPPHTDTSHQQKLRQKPRCRVWLVSHPGVRSWGHGPASSEMSHFHIETTLYFATAFEMTSTESAHFVHLFTDFFPLWPGFEYDFSKRTELLDTWL